MNKKKDKIFIILAFLGVYFLSTGLSFAAFNYLKEEPSGQQQKKGSFDVPKDKGQLLDTSGPKVAPCPLNGEMFTDAEKEAWLKRRPLAVMIENHQEARPQSGLSSADIIYETVAEGGVTRFMGLYYCNAQKQEITLGPVRSARTYFLDWASEYDQPLYAHVGGAHCDPETGDGCLNGAKADALGQIVDYGWEGENDLNQFSIGYPTFWRDYERIGHTVATEHTMYTTTEKLWEVAEKRGWTNQNPEGEGWKENFVEWSFSDGVSETERGNSSEISFSFWEDYKNYNVKWEYDKDNNQYKRFNGGEKHLDLNTEKQLAFKNIVIQFADESPANDGYPGNVHLLYGTIGEGEAIVFQNGKSEKAKWTKTSRKSRTKFFDNSGQEIEFVRGKIWIEILPTGTEVDY